ncbi:MAG: glycosyltransferase family 39 protein, partial [Patescibacteria group bacterium]
MKIIKIAIQRLKHNYILAGIILFGFSLRFYGVYFDYPSVNFIWDEIYNISHLLEIMTYKTIFLQYFPSPYPFFLTFLYIPAVILKIIYIGAVNHLTSLNEIKNLILINGVGQIHIIARWYSVFFGTATIYLIYKIFGYVLKNKASVYYATFAYSISLIPVFLSHWGKVHSAMVFFLALSLYFAMKFEESKKLKFFYGSVAGAAGALSIHYIGTSAFIFPLYAIFANKQLFNSRILVKAGAIYSAISLLFYSLNYGGFIYMLYDQMRYYGGTNYTSLMPVGRYERFYYVFRDYFNIDPVFTVMFIVMAALSFKFLIKDRYARYVLAGWLFNYLLLITIMAAPHMPRWLLISATLSVPLAAGLFVEFLFRRKLNKLVINVLMIMLILPSLYITANWLKLLKHNTYMEAINWLEQNIKNREIVYSFDPLMYAPPSYDSALWDKEMNHVESKKINYILSQKEFFENSGLNLMHDRKSKRYKELAGPNTKYILTGSEAKTTIPNIEKMHKLELVKTFKPSEDKEIEERGLDTDYLNSPD